MPLGHPGHWCGARRAAPASGSRHAARERTLHDDRAELPEAPSGPRAFASLPPPGHVGAAAVNAPPRRPRQYGSRGLPRCPGESHVSPSARAPMCPRARGPHPSRVSVEVEGAILAHVTQSPHPRRVQRRPRAVAQGRSPVGDDARPWGFPCRFLHRSGFRLLRRKVRKLELSAP